MCAGHRDASKTRGALETGGIAVDSASRDPLYCSEAMKLLLAPPWRYEVCVT
jgi:hypothetical protein